MSARIPSLDDFLLLLKGVKQGKDGQFMALCPGHNDRNRSLGVKQTDGKLLIKCFAGCDTTIILRSLNLESKDLFLNSHKAKPEHREIETVYHYEGFEVVRTRPRGFYQRRPDGKGGYINNLKGVTLSLYHQDELPQAIAACKPIFIVEGEKDTHNVRKLGMAATCNPMGAGKWRDSYSQALKGADLVIIPDNDKPGRSHAAKVAELCYGTSKRVRILELPGESKDVSDWLDNGGDIEQLKQLIDQCPDYEPSNNGVKLRRMADVKAEAVSWLWRPFIPKGKVTLEEGDPGIGKSWASLAVATAVTLGKGLPGQETTEPANVLIASAEDGLADTIRPRLDAMGADVSHIFAIDGALILDANGFALLESYLKRIHPALLIIDPLVAYLGASVDMWRANETRAVMAKLSRLAEQFEVAILAVRHLTKGEMSKSIYRGQGSIDFTAACRSVLLAGNDPENPQKRGLVHIKSNLAPLGPSVGYELREGGFYWTGESTLTAAQILAAESTAGTSELDEAIAFLKDELAEGPLPAKDVYRDAEGVGIPKRTLDRAKAQLGVSSRKQGEKGKRGGGIWVWELPDDLHCQKIRGNIPSYTQDGLTLPTLPYQELGNVNTESVLGMSVEDAIGLWQAAGAPVIHLGPGENCFDLAKLLSNSDIKHEHLDAVRRSLDSVRAKS